MALVIGHWLRWLAIFALAVFAVFLAIDILRMTVLIGTSIVLSARKYHSASTERLGWTAVLGQVIQTVVLGLYTAVLYWFFFAK